MMYEKSGISALREVEVGVAREVHLLLLRRLAKRKLIYPQSCQPHSAGSE